MFAEKCWENSRFSQKRLIFLIFLIFLFFFSTVSFLASEKTNEISNFF